MPLSSCSRLLELAVPIWAERAGDDLWHPGHIAERYGLFTIIVLGESVLAATRGPGGARRGRRVDRPGRDRVTGGLLIVFGMWWLYFAEPVGDGAGDAAMAFLWGYGHYLVFAAIGALGAGLEVAVESAPHEAHAGERTAAFAMLPVAVTLLVIAVCRPDCRPVAVALARYAGAAAMVLAALPPLRGGVG